MKQEVRRGRKFVEYHDPDTQDEHTFTQEISGADVSYQDEQGRWQQLVEDWETDGADGFSFRASRMNHKVRFDSIGAWRWYPRRNVETEYLVINRPQCWLTATKRWGNLLVNGISREGKDITLTSLRNVTRVIHSRWNGIKTDWIIENANAPTRFRQKIDLVGITEIAGVLYGADGERLGVLTPTTATDAEGNELPCTGSYVNGYVEFSADVTAAVYPVTIDPDFTTGNKDDYIYGRDGTYSTARSTAYGSATTVNVINIGQVLDVIYQVYRGMLVFDTSSIDDEVTISKVNLKPKIHDIFAADGAYDIQIVKYDWSAWEASQTATTRENAYDGILAGSVDDSILGNTANFSKDTVYTSGDLDTDYINRTGKTYYGLRSSQDVSNSAPTGYAFTNIFSANYSSGAAILAITYYTPPSGPTGSPHYYYAQL